MKTLISIKSEGQRVSLFRDAEMSKWSFDLCWDCRLQKQSPGVVSLCEGDSKGRSSTGRRKRKKRGKRLTEKCFLEEKWSWTENWWGICDPSTVLLQLSSLADAGYNGCVSWRAERGWVHSLHGVLATTSCAQVFCHTPSWLRGLHSFFSFSLISLFYKSLSMKKNGSHVIMLLIGKHKYQ